MGDERTKQLQAQIASWEKRFKDYKKEFEADGVITKEEKAVLESVSSKLAHLRETLLVRVAGGGDPAGRVARPANVGKAWGPMGILRIQVVDSGEKPIPKVTVTVVETKDRKTTDGKGVVEFTDVPGDGNVEVKVKFDGAGYDSKVDDSRTVRIEAGTTNTEVFKYGVKPATSQPAPKPIPLGPVSWGGKQRGQLWGIADENGLIESGGQVFGDYAKLNGRGRQALKDLAQLEALEGRWRSEDAAVRKVASETKARLGELEKAVPAMRKRRKSRSSRDDDFGGDMDKYLEAKENAERIVRKAIPKAAKEYDRASSEFLAAVDKLKAYEATKDVQRAKDKLERTKQEAEKWKSVFGKALEIVVEIKSQNWEKLATKALTYVGEKLVDVSYAEKFAELKRELRAAKKRLEGFEKSALLNQVEAARSGVEIASDGLREAQNDLNVALKQLGRKRVLATDELDESSTTAIAAKLIKERGKQLQRIEKASAACVGYAKFWDAVYKGIEALSKEYGSMALTARIYVGLANRDAMRANEALLKQWHGQAMGPWLDCLNASKWIKENGIVPFDEAIKLIEQGMADSD